MYYGLVFYNPVTAATAKGRYGALTSTESGKGYLPFPTEYLRLWRTLPRSKIKLKQTREDTTVRFWGRYVQKSNPLYTDNAASRQNSRIAVDQ